MVKCVFLRQITCLQLDHKFLQLFSLQKIDSSFLKYLHTAFSSKTWGNPVACTFTDAYMEVNVTP